MRELEKAIKKAGSVLALGNISGVGESTIRMARLRGAVSPTLAKKIAKAVPGISAAKLCGL